jgi:hypothetical protein
MLPFVSGDAEDGPERAEQWAAAEERRVPWLARRVDLDHALHTPAALGAARALAALRSGYRRLRAAIGLPT